MERSIGDINERGYLRGMRRRGYTPQKCILELAANCIDALEKQFHSHIVKKMIAKIERKLIKLIDNGIGMDEDGAAAMFSMHRENHSGDQSKGVSGIGAKPATLILSEDTLVKILTRKEGGAFLAIIVPWDQIIREGVYTGKVMVREMSEEERADFTKDRKENGMLAGEEPVGTTIEFLHRDGLQDLFYQNFLPVDNSSVKDPLDRIHTVLGRSRDVQFQYQDVEGRGKVLANYDYFGDHNPEYYGGIRQDQIEHWWSPRDKKDRYIWVNEGRNYEIVPLGSGLSTQPMPMKTNLHGYMRVGEYRVKTGCRVDPRIFNHDAPATLNCNGYIHSYDKEHLGEDPNEEFLGSTALVRNNQLIGVIPPADIKISSARGSASGWFDLMLVKQDLEYNPVSEQDNPQDIAMGIQENKNQFDGKAIKPELTRILRTIKVSKAKSIRDYMTRRLEEVRPAPVPPPAPPARPAPVPEDEDSESEEDEVESQTATDSEAESVSASESSESASSSESSEEEDSHTPTPTPTPTPEPPAPEPPSPPSAPSVTGADLLALVGRLQIHTTQKYQGEWLMLEAILKRLV